jgi:[acyl-carrier-protein] S-malonyltransferase
MTSTAVLFPGQGSQTPHMRDLVERARPDLIDAASRAVGADPFARADEGTRFAQPAIFCASLAGWERLRGEVEPTFLAGHSLGEVAALVAADALAEEDGLLLVAARGRLMQEAAEAAGDGGMLAVLGRDRRAVEEGAARHKLVLANDNAPTQIVLSGDVRALDAAARDFESRGLRVRRLPVAGAFHSAAMAPAVGPFRALLREIEVRSPRLPVFSCVTGEPFDDVRRLLAQAIAAPMRWTAVVRALHARGVRRFVETGPGRVLAGLVRGTLAGVEAEALTDKEVARA